MICVSGIYYKPEFKGAKILNCCVPLPVKFSETKESIRCTPLVLIIEITRFPVSIGVFTLRK